jgi:hypothetical protein
MRPTRTSSRPSLKWTVQKHESRRKLSTHKFLATLASCSGESGVAMPIKSTFGKQALPLVRDQRSTPGNSEIDKTEKGASLGNGGRALLHTMHERMNGSFNAQRHAWSSILLPIFTRYRQTRPTEANQCPRLGVAMGSPAQRISRVGPGNERAR